MRRLFASVCLGLVAGSYAPPSDTLDVLIVAAVGVYCAIGAARKVDA